MIDQHDTPEAVEAMALGVERTFYSDGGAMLRRLLKRAVDAEAREAAAAMAMRDACAMIAEKRENGMAVWLEGSDIANAIRARGSL